MKYGYMSHIASFYKGFSLIDALTHAKSFPLFIVHAASQMEEIPLNLISLHGVVLC